MDSSARHNRRSFVAAVTTAAAAVHVGTLAPNLRRQSGSDHWARQYQYRVYHHWPQLPDRYAGKRPTTWPWIRRATCT